MSLVNASAQSRGIELSETERQEILDHTARLFPGDVSIETSEDPEDPTSVYLVVRVVGGDQRDSVDDMIDRELQWHREVLKIVPDLKGIIRLMAA